MTGEASPGTPRRAPTHNGRRTAPTASERPVRFSVAEVHAALGQLSGAIRQRLLDTAGDEKVVDAYLALRRDEEIAGGPSALTDAKIRALNVVQLPLLFRLMRTYG